MPLPAGFWYARDTGTLGYSAVTKWASGTSTPPGTVRRQKTTPVAGQEEVFVAIQTATGTTAGVEPTWPVFTPGATVTDNTVTWMEATGRAGMNGDLTNCPNWTAAKSNAIAAGYVIKNNAATFLFICKTAGTAGSGVEPTWNTTAGQTTTDNTVTWTSIGAVGNFGNWAAPHARLYSVLLAYAAAGDTVYIASDHVETAAPTPLSINTTAAAPLTVYSVPAATIPPVAVASGASVTFATGNAVLFNGTSWLFLYGISFTGSATLTFGAGGQNQAVYFESCAFTTTSASTSDLLTIGVFSGTNASRFNFRNCTFVLGNASQSIRLAAGLKDFIGCTFYSSGTAPTTALTCNAGQFGSVRIRDSDLSAVTGNLIDVGATGNGDVSFENCKLGVGVALTTGTQAWQGGIQVKVWNCDSAATNYRFYWSTCMGTSQHSTTVYRVGGASDGVTPLSWQNVSTAIATPLLPFVSQEIFKWTGVASTATIYLTCASTLTSADVWIELEYPGSATSPLATSTITRSALLVSGSTLTTDATSTWVGGLGNNYKIAASFTPQMAGIVKCRVYIGKPSVTFNLDPLIVIS